MGMGEPMLNLDQVLEAARAAAGHRDHPPAHDDLDGRLGSGARGFVDEVEEPIRLALSLHAADQALRSELMPVNDRYPLADVVAECARPRSCGAARSSSST